MEYCENTLSTLKKSYTDLKKLFDDLGGGFGKGSKTGVDEQQFKDLESVLNALKNEFLRFRDDVINSLK